MSDEILFRQINDLINDTISEAEHWELQQRLKSDATARAVFRERMDLEAGLRTWTLDGLIDEQPVVKHTRPTKRPKHSWLHSKVTLIATTASILAIAFWWIHQPSPAQLEVAEQSSQTDPQKSPRAAMVLGRLVQQADCVWELGTSLEENRFSTGMIKLTSGAAELRFDSGTNVVLDGPCEIMVESIDSARLLAGTVFVDVTEVSNGFLLETPASQIIDDGTQYAVSLDSQAAEVHVFDGSVIWAAGESDSSFEERIPSGEARRYLRSEPGRSHHIPFGQRQFVRRIEEAVREAGGGDLLAYDGFENLAGQLRRGRSGFGWAGGWESAGRGRGALAEVIDAPDDVVFGFDRSDRRLLSLQGGDNLRRRFEKVIEFRPGTPLFVSLVVNQQPASDDNAPSIQIFLEPESGSPRYARRHSVSFGITSDGRPFVNNAGMIDETAITLDFGEPFLMVLKHEVHDDKESSASLRVYRKEEQIEISEPSVWTIRGRTSHGPPEFSSIRFASDNGAESHFDELRIGWTWESVTGQSNDERAFQE